ncbi:MAG: short-chain dehydrogenase/reductase [Solirubrobacterales bacterium]|nr:short-chain dehydrogenase/reductase [Solirubrobacterales bacterium]
MPTEKKTFFITGAGRGLGADIARSALAAGHNIVATGRSVQSVEQAVGPHERLLVLPLDITDLTQAQSAVDAAVGRFGRIDVLVNNAGNFIAGFFEELSPAQVQAQVGTLLFGTMNVTRAALPVMRKQRSGQVVSISSAAGIVGQQLCTAYAAGKFGVEGFMESLAEEVEQFGISTTIVVPGFFRTELLTPESTSWSELTIDDYGEQTAQNKTAWDGMNGQQPGDPAKLAEALIGLIDSDEPPARWVAGADAVATVEGKARTLIAQVDAHRALSSSLAHEEVAA